METYYIRHTKKLDIDDATRERVWKERRIAIHFPNYRSGKKPGGKIPRGRPDNASLNVEDYPRIGRGAMRALTELAANGGYVCAEYFQQDKCLLGYVRPGSRIELIRGKWGSGWPGRRAILKSLRLGKVKQVSPFTLAVIQAGRPRQGTIMRWKKAGELIEDAVEGRRSRLSLDRLTPQQQEIMCSEFLRLPKARRLGLPRLRHLLLPLGRTMKDLDICGISGSGRMMFAQVTYRDLEECGQKLKALGEYRDGQRNALVLFCRCAVSKYANGVRIVPLQIVYDTFTASSRGKFWLERARQLILRPR